MRGPAEESRRMLPLGEFHSRLMRSSVVIRALSTEYSARNAHGLANGRTRKPYAPKIGARPFNDHEIMCPRTLGSKYPGSTLMTNSGCAELKKYSAWGSDLSAS